MKIITLNIWGGRITIPLLNFLDEYQDVDIFCFQEVFFETNQEPPKSFKEYKEVKNIYQEIDTLLKNHTGFFTPQMGDFYGLSVFVKNEYLDNFNFENGIIFPDQRKYLDYGYQFTTNLQNIDIIFNNKLISIINLHGLHSGSGTGKGDNDDRIFQAENILKFIKTKKKENIILVGDFNLNPDTRSLKILEDIPLINLIKENNISDTRTSYYKKENRFADYILTSPDIKIKNFRVLLNEVSDHAALYLEIE